MNTESTMNMQTSLPQTDKMTVSATTALPQTGDRLSMENETIKIQVNDLKLYYGNDQALKGIDMVIPDEGGDLALGNDHVDALEDLVVAVLRQRPGPQGHRHGHSRAQGHRLHRAVGLRQVHPAAVLQPDERSGGHLPHHRGSADRRQEHL